MNLLYFTVMSLLLAVVYPVAFLLAVFGRPTILARLRIPSDIYLDGDVVWIHAASMGEAGIAYSMALEIKHRNPAKKIAVSTVTTTGLDRIRSLNEKGDVSVINAAFLAPFDHPWIVGDFIQKVSPSLFLLVETELWPAILTALRHRSVPVAVVNGKIGKSSFRRYMFFRGFFKNLTSNIALLCAQTRLFSRRFRLLGVDPSRIKVIGNVKFDGLPDVGAYDRDQVRVDLGIPPDVPVFVAGSTRNGEEELLLDAFNELLSAMPETVMLIVPRHLKRMPEIENLLHEKSVPYVTRSSGEKLGEKGGEVLVLDTMGELLRAFSCADVSFIGGSFADYGGHNPLEPAALGIPVVFGPFMEQTGSKELLSEGAAVLVHDGDELVEVLKELFLKGDRHKRMAVAGPRAVARFKGTLARTVKALEKRNLL